MANVKNVSDAFGETCHALHELFHMHADMADYMDFMGFMGFKRMHEYYSLKENCELRGMHRYYINHVEMLPPKYDGESYGKFEIPNVWYRYERMDVKADAKQGALKEMCSKWVEKAKWAKQVAQEACAGLLASGEVASSHKLEEVALCLDHELKRASRMAVKLEGCAFDLGAVALMQDDMHAKYKAKEKKLGVSIC